VVEELRLQSFSYYNMAKVAAPGSLTSTLQNGGGALKVGTMVKRKTPSELRVSC